MIRIPLALLALALAAPSPPPPPPQQAQSMTEAEKTDCIAKGGLVARGGKAQIESCRTRFADAGKACTDTSQCQGGCSANLVKPGASHPVGQCNTYSGQFGCQSYLAKGVVHEMCID
jgi:hypothetical protein